MRSSSFCSSTADQLRCAARRIPLGRPRALPSGRTFLVARVRPRNPVARSVRAIHRIRIAPLIPKLSAMPAVQATPALPAPRSIPALSEFAVLPVFGGTPRRRGAQLTRAIPAAVVGLPACAAHSSSARSRRPTVHGHLTSARSQSRQRRGAARSATVTFTKRSSGSSVQCCR